VIETPLSLCILNCYPQASRENFVRQNVGHPHDLFKEFFVRTLPDVNIDVLFIADAGETLPQGTGVASYDGYIWTGSDLTIYHLDDSRVTRQIELAKAIYREGVPSYGSCWGVQMAAVAAGGEVQKNPRGREWGIARDIRLTDDGRHSQLLQGKPTRYDGFIMHLDEVTRMPKGGRLLATNRHTRVQALEVRHQKGTFWATQYHPEYNLHEMARLIAARAEALVAEGFFNEIEDAKAYAAKMNSLHQMPNSSSLKKELDIGKDIIDVHIREQELRNWLDYLVLPARRKK
jgi:GMP synthase (glutamine-hydrolysing)